MKPLRVAFKSFVMTETNYNLRQLCMSDFMETMIKDFMRGDIPVETFVEAMAGTALQIKEDGEDRQKNLERFISGKISYPMWYGGWEK